jgi:hypothetical protein
MGHGAERAGRQMRQATKERRVWVSARARPKRRFYERPAAQHHLNYQSSNWAKIFSLVCVARRLVTAQWKQFVTGEA